MSPALLRHRSVPGAYDEQKVRERLFPTFVHGVLALQSARSAGWLSTYECEEALLKLFTHSAAAAELTSTTPLFCRSYRYRRASCGTGATRYSVKDAEEYCTRPFESLRFGACSAQQPPDAFV